MMKERRIRFHVFKIIESEITSEKSKKDDMRTNLRDLSLVSDKDAMESVMGASVSHSPCHIEVSRCRENK